MPDATIRPPAQVTPPQLPGLNGLLTLATGVVVVAGLYLGREVLVPITLAILLSFVLSPLVEVLRRLHLPHVLSVLVAVIIGLGAIGVIVGVIGLQVAGLAGDVPRYATTIEGKVTKLQGMTVGRLRELTSKLGHHAEPAAEASPAAAEAGATGSPKPIPVTVQPPPTDPLSLAKTVLEPILAPFESAIIIFIVAVFILMQKEDLRDRENFGGCTIDSL